MSSRANGYYSSFTYFASKILFDILPLRVVPPFVFGGIVYGLIGLVPTVAAFWKFMLTLVLFNLTTASVILLLSIAFSSMGVASLVGTLVMLFKYVQVPLLFLKMFMDFCFRLSLLFTGLLINRETVHPAFQWLHTVSFFHAAFEALAVNELRYLQLRQNKVSLEKKHYTSYSWIICWCFISIVRRRTRCTSRHDSLIIWSSRRGKSSTHHVNQTTDNIIND